MKIAVVGTSNCVLNKGWVNYFKTLISSSASIDNFSVDGSASLHGSFSVSQKKIAQNYDFAFLDFAINDQQMVDIKQMTAEYVTGSFSALLRCFAESESRCTPIVLIIPQRDLLTHNRQDIAYNINVKLCEKYGVAYIDLYHVFRTMADDDGPEPKDCFSDWTHLAEFTQIAVAKAALRAVEILRPSCKPDSKLLKEASRCFAVPDADVEISEEIRQVVGTSYMQAEVRTFGVGARGVIRNTPWLCGVIHWIDPDSGAICFSGTDAKVKKGLRKEWVRMFGLTHFQAPLRAGTDIAFTFGNFEEYPFDRTYGMTPTTSLDGTRADLIGFIGADRDPVKAGAELLKSVGGAESPAGVFERRLELGLPKTILSEWVKELRRRRVPVAPEAIAVAATTELPAQPAAASGEAPIPEVTSGVIHRSPTTHAVAVDLPEGSRTLLPLPIQSGVMVISAEVSLLRGILGYRCGPRPQLHSLGQAIPNVQLVAGPLGDEPGRKSFLTIGLSGDRLEIENRRGGKVALSIFFMG